ncbi:MAG: HDOD domain-containing protein [Desulfobacca sp.]|nr:HDOD domain-containing protein [Desulfobacca sp.]
MTAQSEHSPDVKSTAQSPTTDSQTRNWGPDEAIGVILHSIEEGPLIPAFRNNIQELLSVQGDTYGSVQATSRIILRDFSLTTQILKLVNTVYFKTYWHQVHTITNAIMLLGLERIRNLAVGLRLFENFSRSQNLYPLRRLIISSFFTALLSQALTQDDRRYQGEEIFITGLLFNLGELIAAYYLPEDYERILQIAAQQGITRSRAAKRVLKVSWEELGLAILRKWQFPAGLVKRLIYLHMGSDTREGDEARLRLLVQNAHELSQSLLEAKFSPEEWQNRLQHCGKRLGLTSDRLDQIITTSIDGILELTKTLKINLQELNLPIFSIKGTSQNQLNSEASVSGEDQQAHPDSQSSGRIRPPLARETMELEKLRLFHWVIGEINQALVTHVGINEIMGMIVEGIYRSIGFDRVIFAILNPARTQISARFGLGAGIEDLLPVLQLPSSPSDNIFAQALAERREYEFKAGDQQGNLKLMPERFWEIIGDANFLVSPILVNEVPIGLFYVDRCGSWGSCSDEDRQRLEIFRNLTTIALRCCCSTFSTSQFKVP